MAPQPKASLRFRAALDGANGRCWRAQLHPGAQGRGLCWWHWGPRAVPWLSREVSVLPGCSSTFSPAKAPAHPQPLEHQLLTQHTVLPVPCPRPWPLPVAPVPQPWPLPAAPVPVLVPCPQPCPSAASPAAVTPAGLGAAGPTACLLFPAQSLRFASSGRFTLLLLSLGIKSLEKAAGRPSVPGTEGSGCAQPGRWNLAQGDEERSQPPCTSDLGCRGEPTRGDVPGLAMHQPHVNVQTPNPSKAGRNPKITPTRPPPGSSPRPVGPRRRGCTPRPRRARVPRRTGSQVRRGAPCQRTRCAMLSFHTAPARGRAAAKPLAALFPTLVAIKKCKFIFFFFWCFSPHAKRSLGITAPRSGGPGERGSCWGGKPPGEPAAAAPMVSERAGQHAMPRGAGSALGCGFPFIPVLSIPE